MQTESCEPKWVLTGYVREMQPLALGRKLRFYQRRLTELAPELAAQIAGEWEGAQ